MKRMRWRVAVPLAASTAVVVAFGLAAGIELTKDPRQTMSLSEIYDPSDNSIVAFDGMHQDTHVLCAGVEGCVQGYRADHAEFRRFGSLESAKRFATATSGSYQSDWIVIRYTDSMLTPTQRNEVQSYVDGLATSD